MSRLLRVLLPICILVLGAVGALSTWSINQYVLTVEEQNRALALQVKLDYIDHLIHKLEASQRGYLITSNAVYLFTYEDSLPRVQRELKELKAMVSRDPLQTKGYGKVAAAVKAKLGELQATIDLAKQHKLEDAIRMADTDSSIRLMNQVNDSIQQMNARVEMDIKIHGQFINDYSNYAVPLVAAGTIFALVLVVVFAWVTYLEIHKRTKIAADLSRAQQAAVVASRLKSQFLAMVSHELRTPLNGILGMSDILRGKLHASEEKNMVQLIHQSGSTLLKIVNEILDFSKIEAGKVDFEIASFSLLELVESSAELLSVKAKEKNLTLLTYVDPELPIHLNGDPSRINQVVQNLLGNALKFTERGGIYLYVTREHDSRASGTVVVRFEIRDTGYGIPESLLPLLFQPFNQLTRGERQRGEGTGLGLSICKNLVERMDGKIGVDSREGQGSTFWFTLPFKVGSETKISALFDVANFSAASSNVCAVLIGGNEFLRDLLSLYFQEMRIPFQSELNTVEALEKYLAHAPPQEKILALFDCGDFSDKQLLKANNAMATEARILPLALARGWFEQVDRASLYGKFQGFLRTPIARSQFFEMVRALLSPNRQLGSEAEKVTLTQITGGAKVDRGGALASAQNPAANALVLVVEDNSVNQTIAKIYIEQMGYRVHTVSNGQEALDAIDRIAYDLIFMDVQMPVLDGIEATQRIRSRESSSGRHIPIVAMTANAIPGDRERCLAAGMDDYLSKPFQQEDICRALDRWLTSQLPTVDWSILETLGKKTNLDVVKKLSDSFQSTVPKSLKEIQDARDAGNTEGVRFWAHQLKSSSAALGAVLLAESCGKLEAMVIAQAELPQLLEEIERLLKLGERSLEEFRRGPKPSSAG